MHAQRQKRDSEIIRNPIEIDIQFGELPQVGQVFYMRDGVVLQEQVGEVGGKAQVAYVRYPIVIQVQDGEVSAHRDVILQRESQRQSKM